MKFRLSNIFRMILKFFNNIFGTKNVETKIWNNLIYRTDSDKEKGISF